MATEFTDLAHTTIKVFSTLVTDLLQNSSTIVNYVLQMENEAGVARINQTEAQVLTTATELIAYARNGTLQSEAQIQGLVVTFGSFVNDTLGQFQQVSQAYSIQLRYEFAMKAQTAFQANLESQITAMMRLDALYHWGSGNITKPLNEFVTGNDAEFLAAVCAWSAEIGAGLYCGTASGNDYYCSGPGATMSWMNRTGPSDTYTRLRLMWTNVTGSDPVESKNQILTQTPTYSVLGTNCSLAPQCNGVLPTCGYDPRCRPWYRQYDDPEDPRLQMSPVYANDGTTDVAVMTLTYSIIDQSTTPKLAAVLANDFDFSIVNTFLSTIGTSNGTHLAVLVNDSDLTVMGSVGASCGVNEMNPGDPSLPAYSALRSCDLRLAALGSWLLAHRDGLPNHTAVQINDTVWDVFPSSVAKFTYYTVVGMELWAMYGAIWAAETNATAMFNILWNQESLRIAATASQTHQYIQAVQATNVEQTQSMRESLLAQLAALANASQQLLQTSQGQSTKMIGAMMQSQMEDVDALRVTHLHALNITAAWTIGVVIAMLLVVLFTSSFGTVRIATSLVEIIVLMESVADMQVEQLEVPQNAFVVEVARIQAAFQALVRRLAEYKSYMPASLFQSTTHDTPVVVEKASDTDGESKVSGRDRRSTANGSSHAGLPGMRLPRGAAQPMGKGLLPKHNDVRLTRRMVAAGVFNVCGFQKFLEDHDGAVEVALASYVSVIHESVAQAQGHIDCVLGDQVFSSFNAHIPCSDPVQAAGNAALNFQASLTNSKASVLTCQVGLACGPMITGSTGYARFKTMVSLGTPMKMAALLAHLSQFDNGGILCDPSVEERLKFTHQLCPVDVVHLPNPRASITSNRKLYIYLVLSKKTLVADEWMYQLQHAEGNWEVTFLKVSNAKSLEEAHLAVQDHLTQSPNDVWAQRMLARLPAWLPGLGIRMCEGTDHVVDLLHGLRKGHPNKVSQADSLVTTAEGFKLSVD